MVWTARAPNDRSGRPDPRFAILKGSAWAYESAADRQHAAAAEALSVTDRQPFVGFRCAADLPAR